MVVGFLVVTLAIVELAVVELAVVGLVICIEQVVGFAVMVVRGAPFNLIM